MFDFSMDIVGEDKALWDKLERDLSADPPEVSVGVEDSARTKGKLSNSQIGATHEFGLGVPSRPFLRPTFEENGDRYFDAMKRILRALVDGKGGAAIAMDRLGARVVRDVKSRIRAGIPPALAASTVARKGHSRTLRETDQLYKAIKHKVEP